MKYNKIVLAGGNGYLGTVLANYYKPLAGEIVILSRHVAKEEDTFRTEVWNGKEEDKWIASLENADLLINLCGKNVNCRYTDKNKKEIIDSRMIPTALLGTVIGKMSAPPKLWINITSATIYRHAEDRAQDEESGEIGYGFSIDVCKQWEEVFFSCVTPATRKVALRMSIVLGRGGGAFPRLLNLVKAGMGGKQGTGNQYVSWIHEQDAARCTEWIMDHTELSGAINCTAPAPLQNHFFMKMIRNAYGISFGLPAPAWLLEMGAVMIGTETELILKSRWVIPKRLMDSGFHFQYATAEHAVDDLVSIRK